MMAETLSIPLSGE